MRSVIFQNQILKVDNHIKYITQDAQGMICGHATKPAQGAYDEGCQVWVSPGRQELYFPKMVCEEIP